MRTYSAIVLAFFLCLAKMSFGPASTFEAKVSEKNPPHLVFVRQFSSGQDIQREHPILNRSIDIIAGPKDAESPNYELQEPYGVTTDSSHRVFVTDVRARAVHVFDFANSKYSRLRGGEGLHLPVAVAADREGNVYVSDRGLQTILVYDSRGKFARQLKKANGAESYFDSVQGIAVDSVMGRIYVCDPPRHMVFALNHEGRVLARFGKRFGGEGLGEFRYPSQVVAAGGEIVVLDAGNYRIQILDTRGHFLKQFKLPDVSNSTGLAMDGDGNIYLTDPQLNQLQVFSHSGEFLYKFGESGTGPGQFNGMSGIWVDSGHCLYVVDSKNKRVQLFRIAAANADGC
jgi:DNA-binding beta-propeller fold protein YncE